MAQNPCLILRDHLGLNISEFAQESAISRPSVYMMEGGEGCGSGIWRKLRDRWPRELRALGLTADDFLEGEVLGAGPVRGKRRGAG